MKKEIKTELTKEKILNAAIVEFGANGYAGGSLNNICNAGIAKGLLYHNFKNKDAIYLACVSRCFNKITDYLKNQELGCSLQRYMHARMQFFRDNELEAKLFMEALLRPPIALAEQIKELRQKFDSLNFEFYKEILTDVRLRKNITQKDAIQYFTLMQDMFNGYYSNPTLCGLPFSEAMDAHEENLPKLFHVMLYGIAEGGIES